MADARAEKNGRKLGRSLDGERHRDWPPLLEHNARGHTRVYCRERNEHYALTTVGYQPMTGYVCCESCARRPGAEP